MKRPDPARQWPLAGCCRGQRRASGVGHQWLARTEPRKPRDEAIGVVKLILIIVLELFEATCAHFNPEKKSGHFSDLKSGPREGLVRMSFEAASDCRRLILAEALAGSRHITECLLCTIKSFGKRDLRCTNDPSRVRKNCRQLKSSCSIIERIRRLFAASTASGKVARNQASAGQKRRRLGNIR